MSDLSNVVGKARVLLDKLDHKLIHCWQVAAYSEGGRSVDNWLTEDEAKRKADHYRARGWTVDQNRPLPDPDVVETAACIRNLLAVIDHMGDSP